MATQKTTDKDNGAKAVKAPKAVTVKLSPVQKAAEAFAQASAYADLVIGSNLPERNGEIRGRTAFSAKVTQTKLSS